MTQYEVYLWIERVLRESTSGDDHWPRAWCEGLWESSSSTKTIFEGTVVFDRDRCPQERAREIARAVEVRFRREHATLKPLELRVWPTTRITVALARVQDHFEDVDVERLQRGGEAWAYVAEVVPRPGWMLDEDRIIVELVADSSADEREARDIGLAWLAELLATYPELANIVEVIGSSH